MCCDRFALPLTPFARPCYRHMFALWHAPDSGDRQTFVFGPRYHFIVTEIHHVCH